MWGGGERIYVAVYTKASMWRSDANLHESGFSYAVGPSMEWTQVDLVAGTFTYESFKLRQSSYLSFLGAKIIGLCYHAQVCAMFYTYIDVHTCFPIAGYSNRRNILQ